MKMQSINSKDEERKYGTPVLLKSNSNILNRSLSDDQITITALKIVILFIGIITFVILYLISIWYRQNNIIGA